MSVVGRLSGGINPDSGVTFVPPFKLLKYALVKENSSLPKFVPFCPPIFIKPRFSFTLKFIPISSVKFSFSHLPVYPNFLEEFFMQKIHELAARA